jgi:6-phosphogluconolactonase
MQTLAVTVTGHIGKPPWRAASSRSVSLGLMSCALAVLVCLACSPPRSGVERSVLSSDEKRGMKDGVDRPVSSRRVVIYSSEGAGLHTHALDAETGALALTSSVVLPEPVHYAAADPAARFLYVSASNGTTSHGLHAFRIDPQTGALTPHGAPLLPPLGRIIHLSVGSSGHHLVLAHNRAAELSSVRLAADGSLAAFVEQATPARTGFFAHQALLDPAGTGLIACGLGAEASDPSPEQPGSLTVFRFHDGQLTQQQTVLPGPGLGARHLDYAGDRVFVAMERGNRLYSYRYREGRLEEPPEFDVPTLKQPGDVAPGQRAGAIHLHPSGEFVYVSNRATRTRPVAAAGQAVEVFAGGENDIALFALQPGSGEPRLVDHYDTRGFEPRTFTIEPSGRFLIVANQSERQVLAASGEPHAVPRSVVVFEIGAGGKLEYRWEYAFTGGELFWIGAVQLPG